MSFLFFFFHGEKKPRVKFCHTYCFSLGDEKMICSLVGFLYFAAVVTQSPSSFKALEIFGTMPKGSPRGARHNWLRNLLAISKEIHKAALPVGAAVFICMSAFSLHFLSFI